jgi:ubiquinone/menaquinone biosynthesis C-methylase UbiE
MTTPRASISFDRIADRYDETRGGEGRGRSIAADLHAHLRPDQVVLEVGVGTGLVALGLRELGHRVVGIDLSPAMLRQAWTRLGPVVAVGDAARLPIRGGAIPQAVSVWVLHLVGDLRAVFREVARVLAPGGRYLVVPAGAGTGGDDVSELLRAMNGRLDAGRPRHSRDQLLAAAAAAGLELVEAVAGTPDRYTRTPVSLAEMVETRTFSNLWHVGDDVWRTVVMPVVAALRALPDADQPRGVEVPRELLVLERRGERPRG